MSLASNKRSLWIIQLWPYQQNRTYSQPLPLLPTYSQLHLLLWLPWALDCQLHNESMRVNEAVQKYVTRVLLPRNSTYHIREYFLFKLISFTTLCFGCSNANSSRNQICNSKIKMPQQSICIIHDDFTVFPSLIYSFQN